MRLERGEMQTECETTKAMIDAREFDTLKNTRRARPITLQNRYEAFQEDNESDDDGDEEVSNNSIAQIGAIRDSATTQIIQTLRAFRRADLQGPSAQDMSPCSCFFSFLPPVFFDLMFSRVIC